MHPNKPSSIAPPLSRGALPYGDADGTVLVHAGRYARECVLVAFEMIGGVERLADWASKNPDAFFTRLYPKVITREIEVGTTEGVEALLARLDGSAALDHGETQEADYEVVE